MKGLLYIGFAEAVFECIFLYSLLTTQIILISVANGLDSLMPGHYVEGDASP